MFYYGYFTCLNFDRSLSTLIILNVLAQWEVIFFSHIDAKLFRTVPLCGCLATRGQGWCRVRGGKTAVTEAPPGLDNVDAVCAMVRQRWQKHNIYCSRISARCLVSPINIRLRPTVSISELKAREDLCSHSAIDFRSG